MSRLAGYVLLTLGLALLLYDLDHVPAWSLLVAVASFVVAANLIGRRRR